MKLFNTVKELIAHLDSLRNSGISIGFVPTMGALHIGHGSLIKKAKEENDIAVCSIFVNPIQFNNAKDLTNYPRDINKDILFLEEHHCDVLFNPSEKEIYPETPTKKFDFGSLEEVMEGKFRPGHFNGVATVVKRLFEIVVPHKAYFGLKDFQQLVIIRKLIEKIQMDVEIVGCETVRNENGLAFSSRNELLSSEEKIKATQIYQSLLSIRSAKNNQPAQEAIQAAIDVFNQSSDFELEYLELADANTLKPISNWDEADKFVVCIAVYLGKVRLIDNILF